MKYLNPLLIVTGLLFLASAYYGITLCATPYKEEAHNTPGQWQFWIPLEYTVIRIPDYALTHTIIGTASITAALTRILQKTIKTQQPL
jgi:hypothetical protein